MSWIRLARIALAALALATPAEAVTPVEAHVEAVGLVWRAPVAKGLSFDDVDASLLSLAASMKLRDAGQLPLGGQVEPMRENQWRQLKIYMFYNPLTAAEMIEYDPAFSVWLPCRVSLVEDTDGALWLHTINMDAILAAAKDMPAELRAEAMAVRNAIFLLMNGASQGKF